MNTILARAAGVNWDSYIPFISRCKMLFYNEIRDGSSRDEVVKSYRMQISQALKQLHQVAFDLGLCKGDGWVLQKSRKVVFHVRHDHVHARLLPTLA